MDRYPCPVSLSSRSSMHYIMLTLHNPINPLVQTVFLEHGPQTRSPSEEDPAFLIGRGGGDLIQNLPFRSWETIQKRLVFCSSENFLFFRVLYSTIQFLIIITRSWVFKIKLLLIKNRLFTWYFFRWFLFETKAKQIFPIFLFWHFF